MPSITTAISPGILRSCHQIRRSSSINPVIRRCGIDVLLAGHLHDAHVVERVIGLRALMVQAGTATSSRTREQPNSFNLLRVDRGRIAVEQHVLDGAGFVRASAECFERREAGWLRCGPCRGPS
jgi:hypothetical protein